MSKKNTIVIIDFGSQYTQLIAKKIRQMKVYSVIYSYRITFEELKKRYNIKGIILSGGPNSVYDDHSLDIDKNIFNKNIPILGICYGMQLIIHKKGGKVEPSNHKEYGFEKVIKKSEAILFEDVPDNFQVWMSHADHVSSLPNKFKDIASTDYCIAGVSNDEEKIYGLQFHPEVTHSQYGETILSNFIFKICKMDINWEIVSFIEKSVLDIRELVQDKKVVLGLSGGVDSMTLAFLLEKAIKNNLTCIFINNGLLRKNEENQIQNEMKKYPNINFIYKDESQRFLTALKGILDPEKKRKIIGKLFIDVFDVMSGDFDYLAQGTLYTDVIESVSVRGPSDTIKTHHNRVQEVLDLIEKKKVIEPFKELFKDEVREIGKELKMGEHLISRQPFPGPGLSIRILGEVTRERLDILKEADMIFLEEIKSADLYKKLWQSFCVLLPIKSVGVVGDNRTYGYTIVLRAVSSIDGMTADFEHLSKDLLTKVSSRIIGEIDGIARVVLDVTSKPPGTIEWE